MMHASMDALRCYVTKNKSPGKNRRKGHYRANTGPTKAYVLRILRTFRRMDEGGTSRGHDDLEEGVV